MTSTEDVYEERLARYLELAEAAQEASERAPELFLKVTYAQLASQWVQLAQMAARMTAFSPSVGDSTRQGRPDQQVH